MHEDGFPDKFPCARHLQQALVNQPPPTPPARFEWAPANAGGASSGEVDVRLAVTEWAVDDRQINVAVDNWSGESLQNLFWALFIHCARIDYDPSQPAASGHEEVAGRLCYAAACYNDRFHDEVVRAVRAAGHRLLVLPQGVCRSGDESECPRMTCASFVAALLRDYIQHPTDPMRAIMIPPPSLRGWMLSCVQACAKRLPRGPYPAPTTIPTAGFRTTFRELGSLSTSPGFATGFGTGMRAWAYLYSPDEQPPPPPFFM